MGSPSKLVHQKKKSFLLRFSGVRPFSQTNSLFYWVRTVTGKPQVPSPSKNWSISSYTSTRTGCHPTQGVHTGTKDTAVGMQPPVPSHPPAIP